MSFRYTNELIGVLKHRLLLESANRRIASRTFTGTCNGVEAVCTGYGSLLSLRTVDGAKTDARMRKLQSDGSAGPIDYNKLATSIRGAVWDAVEKIRAAKQEAQQNSLAHNEQLQSRAQLQQWFEDDANTLRPHAYQGLTNHVATPWMQLIRLGKAAEARKFLTEAKGGSGPDAAGSLKALQPEDCDPANIPIASVDPLYTAALLPLELNGETCSNPRANAPVGVSPTEKWFPGSRINAEHVLVEQRKELNMNEHLFWERVELIRKGQASVIRGEKRGYVAHASSVDVDSAPDKVELRFTQ